GYCNRREVFQVLVTQLALHAQTHRRPMRDGKIATVHTVGQQSLRMPCVRHVQTVPPSIDTIKKDIPGLWLNTGLSEDPGKRNACPFRDCRPTLLADVFCNLRARRIASQLSEGKFRRPGDHPIDRKPPLAETGTHVPPVKRIFGQNRINGGEICGNLIPAELTSKWL